MKTLGVVIPCYRQERFLARTLGALGALPSGWTASGVVVPAAEPITGVALPGPSWSFAPPPDRTRSGPLKPGAARMAGLASCRGDWVLFADADVEMDGAWLERALERITAMDPTSRLAGLWGRIEEWFVDGDVERRGSPDLYRLGAGERAVDYLATVALYRRDALRDAGGYDPRLSSEEDFELGLRLRARGWELITLDAVAARHWSGPRPSFSELARRWSTGLCFGAGEVLKLYAGRPGFATLLRRQRHYLAMLALLGLGVVALSFALVRANPGPLLGWLALPLALLVFMTARKRSARLAAHSLLAWTQGALGMAAGWWRFDPRRSEAA